MAKNQAENTPEHTPAVVRKWPTAPVSGSGGWFTGPRRGSVLQQSDKEGRSLAEAARSKRQKGEELAQQRAEGRRKHQARVADLQKKARDLEAAKVKAKVQAQLEGKSDHDADELTAMADWVDQQLAEAQAAWAEQDAALNEQIQGTELSKEETEALRTEEARRKQAGPGGLGGRRPSRPTAVRGTDIMAKERQAIDGEKERMLEEQRLRSQLAAATEALKRCEEALRAEKGRLMQQREELRARDPGGGHAERLERAEQEQQLLSRLLDLENALAGEPGCDEVRPSDGAKSRSELVRERDTVAEALARCEARADHTARRGMEAMQRQRALTVAVNAFRSGTLRKKVQEEEDQQAVAEARHKLRRELGRWLARHQVQLKTRSTLLHAKAKQLENPGDDEDEGASDSRAAEISNTKAELGQVAAEQVALRMLYQERMKVLALTQDEARAGHARRYSHAPALPSPLAKPLPPARATPSPQSPRSPLSPSTEEPWSDDKLAAVFAAMAAGHAPPTAILVEAGDPPLARRSASQGVVSSAPPGKETGQHTSSPSKPGPRQAAQTAGSPPRGRPSPVQGALRRSSDAGSPQTMRPAASPLLSVPPAKKQSPTGTSARGRSPAASPAAAAKAEQPSSPAAADTKSCTSSLGPRVQSEPADPAAASPAGSRAASPRSDDQARSGQERQQEQVSPPVAVQKEEQPPSASGKRRAPRKHPKPPPSPAETAPPRPLPWHSSTVQGEVDNAPIPQWPGPDGAQLYEPPALPRVQHRERPPQLPPFPDLASGCAWRKWRSVQRQWGPPTLPPKVDTSALVEMLGDLRPLRTRGRQQGSPGMRTGPSAMPPQPAAFDRWVARLERETQRVLAWVGAAKRNWREWLADCIAAERAQLDWESDGVVLRLSHGLLLQPPAAEVGQCHLRRLVDLLRTEFHAVTNLLSHLAASAAELPEPCGAIGGSRADSWKQPRAAENHPAVAGAEQCTNVHEEAEALREALHAVRLRADRAVPLVRKRMCEVALRRQADPSSAPVVPPGVRHVLQRLSLYKHVLRSVPPCGPRRPATACRNARAGAAGAEPAAAQPRRQPPPPPPAEEPSLVVTVRGRHRSQAAALAARNNPFVRPGSPRRALTPDRSSLNCARIAQCAPWPPLNDEFPNSLRYYPAAPPRRPRLAPRPRAQHNSGAADAQGGLPPLAGRPQRAQAPRRQKRPPATAAAPWHHWDQTERHMPPDSIRAMNALLVQFMRNYTVPAGQSPGRTGRAQPAGQKSPKSGQPSPTVGTGAAGPAAAGSDAADAGAAAAPPAEGEGAAHDSATAAEEAELAAEIAEAGGV